MAEAIRLKKHYKHETHALQTDLHLYFFGSKNVKKNLCLGISMKFEQISFFHLLHYCIVVADRLCVLGM